MSTLAAFGSLALAHAGLTGLALAMDRHRPQLRPSAKLPESWAAATSRTVGWALLALSMMFSMLAWGTATGIAVWFGVLSTTGLTLILMLPYAPMLAWRAGWITATVGLAAAFASLAAG